MTGTMTVETGCGCGRGGVGRWTRTVLSLVAIVVAGCAAAPADRLDAQDPPAAAATLADFAWLAGVWMGEGPGGATNETHYMSPAGGVIPGMMRLYAGEELMVIELFDIVAGEGGLEMRLRHFDGRLSAWEADGPLVMHLRTLDGGRSTWSTAEGAVPGIESEIVRGDGYYDTRTVVTRADGSRQVMEGRMVRRR